MGMLCICLKKSSSRVRVGIVVVVTKGTVVEGDIEEDESIEVIAEEEYHTIIGAIGEEEARCTKISIMGGEEDA